MIDLENAPSINTISGDDFLPSFGKWVTHSCGFVVQIA